MKVETVKVNGVMVNKGEEDLAKKWAGKAKKSDEAGKVPEVAKPAAEAQEPRKAGNK
jgi:hypothetical protein